MGGCFFATICKKNFTFICFGRIITVLGLMKRIISMYTLISSSGKVMIFTVYEVAVLYKSLYGGVIVDKTLLSVGLSAESA
jgi:hypothetical protein